MRAKTTKSDQNRRRSILDMTHDEARTFLLKSESYCKLELPPYISFDDLINGVRQVLDGDQLVRRGAVKPRDCEGVNYTILHNKDGRHLWRPFELIHPALYVSLVHTICETNNWALIQKRFQDFSVNENLTRCGPPIASTSDEKDRAEEVVHWLANVERPSIELSLDYNYLIETDIRDCYSSIYTHSIAWALHGKNEAKKRDNRGNPDLLGNVIDWHIQDMRHGQTNGIPQGSVLMDLIAEMIFGVADMELSERISNEIGTDYRILRFRDDYRVFTNSLQDGDAILKLITETLANYGLKLGEAKTKRSDNVIQSSLKSDKLVWIDRKQSSDDLQNQLLIIHDHSASHPNKGSVLKALIDFYDRLSETDTLPTSPIPLIAIVADIAYRNPRSYALCAAILTKLLGFVESNDEKLSLAQRIRKKFDQLPNTGHMTIWLQRITIKLDRDVEYNEPVCELVAGTSDQLWNNDWISSKRLQKALDARKIVDEDEIDDLEAEAGREEVELFAVRGVSEIYG